MKEKLLAVWNYLKADWEKTVSKISVLGIIFWLFVHYGIPFLSHSYREYKTRNLVDVIQKNHSTSLQFCSFIGNTKVPSMIIIEQRFFIKNITANKVVEVKPDNTVVEMNNVNVDWGYGGGLSYEPTDIKITSDNYVKLNPEESLECILKSVFIPDDKNQQDFYRDIEAIGDISITAKVYIALPYPLTLPIGGSFTQVSRMILETYNEIIASGKEKYLSSPTAEIINHKLIIHKTPGH